MASTARRVDAFSMGEGERAVLLLHGFTASPSQFFPMGEYLASRGYFVQCICLPGHGTRIEDMNSVTWRDWLSAAREAARELRRAHSKVYVAGLSMGGVLSLLLAEEGLADAVAPMAAPMKLSNETTSKFARFLWPFYRVMPDGPPRDMPGFLSAYDFCYDGTPLRRVGDLRRLMHMAQRGLPQLRCPLLVVHSRKDETAQPVSADIIYAGASSQRKELMMLDNSPHVLILGPERERVFSHVADFFARN